MPERPSFQEQQRAFAAHIRDPDRHPRPSDVPDRRMAVYRELLYNNVESFMAASFPVLRRITSDARWHAMIRDYFVRHIALTPLFTEMPREFLKYLQTERQAREDPPFLAELAHYEWVELALAIADPEPDTEPLDPQGDLLRGQPVLSPLAWPLTYRFPVHRISPDFQPEQPDPAPTHLLVYRDAEDEVRFMQLQPATAVLIERIRAQSAGTGAELLLAIAAELGHPDPDMVLQSGKEILDDLRARGIVLGVRR